jgi:flagellar assembly factor FliW
VSGEPAVSLVVETAEPPSGLSAEGVSGGPVLLRFASGIPGFPGARRFGVVGLGQELEPFCRLECLDEPGLGFIVVPPGLLYPDYAVEIGEDALDRLGIEGPDDVVVLVIVTLARPPAEPTANLLGPIVVNRHTHMAAQVVQHRLGYSAAVPLTAKSARAGA